MAVSEADGYPEGEEPQEAPPEEVEEPRPPPRRGRNQTLSVEQRDRIEAMLQSGTYTQDQVAEATGTSKGAVNKLAQRLEAARDAAKAPESDAVAPDPMDLFRRFLRGTPGIPKAQADWVITIAEGNPDLLRNPTELDRLLTEFLKLKPFLRQMLINRLMSVQQQPGGPAFYPGMPPQPGYPGYPPGMPGMGGPGMPPWGMASAPPWGAWAPPPWWSPRRDDGLTKQDVAEIVAKAMEKHQAPPPPPSVEYEEVQEPLLRGDGKPVKDDDGNPVVRYVRRPIKEANGPDFFERIIQLKQAGFFGESNPKSDVHALEIQHLKERLAEKRTDDPESRRAIDEMRQSAADIKAQLAAEQARREAQDKYQIELARLQERGHQRDLETAAARAGMPADAQIIERGLGSIEKTVDRAMANQDKRAARLEALAMQLLKPADAGAPVPSTQEEVDRFLAATERIDAREAIEPPPPAPPAPEPTTPPADAPLKSRPPSPEIQETQQWDSPSA